MPTATNPPRVRLKFCICLLLVGVTLAIYWPALHGGFVWDDDSWTTKIENLLYDTSGLRAIWFHPAALQQYYPVSATTFWLDYHLWKWWTTPYHVENVLLHALAALLFWKLLLQLRVPGAWLAGAIFAVHPVMVQSVAWITERKNVLSLVFYLGALLAYGQYVSWWTGEKKTAVPNSACNRWRPLILYGLAFVLFLGAILAKTTAFSLPAVILLIGWWKRGQIRWREDVFPMLPFFAVSLGLSALVIWLERYHLGAQGQDFSMTFPQRCLIAGRAFWFYLGKLLWPANICFVYKHWQPDPHVWRQWLYPATAVGLLLTPWMMRARIGRGPATALFFYVGTLFPLLGFINGYGMRYSFVWNQWVYLPSLGIIALAAALMAWAAESWRAPRMLHGFGVIALLVLALLTWREAGTYRDMETLWRVTLAKNPDCAMAYSNLGVLLESKGRPEEAMDDFHKAIQYQPDLYEALNNLGVVLTHNGQLDEAIGYYRKSILIHPNNPEALNDLGVALAQKGQMDEAMENFRKAFQINPNFPEVLNNLGFALAKEGRLDEAIEYYRKAIRMNPDNPGTLNYLGVALAKKGRLEEAIENFRKALRISPNNPEALDNLGVALAKEGRLEEAIEKYRQAIRINPSGSRVFLHLGMAYEQLDRTSEAVSQYREALKYNPDDDLALKNLALILATSSDAKLRNGAEAVQMAERACQLTQYGQSSYVATLAAAYAEAGRFDEAIATTEKAIALCEENHQPGLAQQNREMLGLYRQHRAYHKTR